MMVWFYWFYAVKRTILFYDYSLFKQNGFYKSVSLSLLGDALSPFYQSIVQLYVRTLVNFLEWWNLTNLAFGHKGQISATTCLVQ